MPSQKQAAGTPTPKTDAIVSAWSGKNDCGYLQADVLNLSRTLERELRSSEEHGRNLIRTQMAIQASLATTKDECKYWHDLAQERIADLSAEKHMRQTMEDRHGEVLTELVGVRSRIDSETARLNPQTALLVLNALERCQPILQTLEAMIGPAEAKPALDQVRLALAALNGTPPTA